MKIFRYRAADAEANTDPFRGEYVDDLWICYHGTSNHYEAIIEKEGLRWKPDTYSRSDVAALTSIFESLHWIPSDTAGYSVLATFTQGDFASGMAGAKPIFFAESGHRGVVYAGRDWAGGETARALRHAFVALDSYLASPELRREALKESFRQLRGFYRAPVPSGCDPEPGRDPSWENLRNLWAFYREQGMGLMRPYHVQPRGFDADLLREQLAGLSAIRARADAMYETYQRGVVYAVRFEVSDIGHLHYGGGGGLRALVPIGPDRIVAKAIIDPDVLYRRVGSGGGLDPDSAARIRATRGDGVVGRVRRRGPHQSR